MFRPYLFVTILANLCIYSSTLQSEEAKPNHSHYAGQENREIKSLSENDIKELQAGSGWGLAKAAELNGVPGPKHLLELQNEIDLSADQIEKIESLFTRMNAAAKALGAQLIQKEKELEGRFRESLPSKDELRELLSDIGEIRAELRYVHLASHLETPNVLTPNQIERYNQLRGYASSSDPCDQVPEGHDANMWKRHNGCE